MFISFGDLIEIAILIIGIFWCKEIFGRLPKDIEELRNKKDETNRFVIIFFWVITAGYIIFVIKFIWGIILSFLKPPV